MIWYYQISYEIIVKKKNQLKIKSKDFIKSFDIFRLARGMTNYVKFQKTKTNKDLTSGLKNYESTGIYEPLW